jgi:hypothetical protein
MIRRPVTLAVAVGVGVSTTVAGVLPPAVAAPPAPGASAPSPDTPALPPGLLVLLPGLVLSPAGVATPGVGPARLKAALLTAADLRAGYRTVVPPTVVPGNLLIPRATASTPGGSPCDILMGSQRRAQPGHTASVLLQRGMTGPVLGEILATGSPRAARDYVRTTAEQVRRCPRFTIGVADSTDQIVVTQSRLPLRQVGDASFASAFSVKIGGMRPVHGTMLALAKGHVAGALVSTAARGEPGAFRTIVNKAVRKVNALE